MRLEAWSSEAHLPILQGWADQSEDVAKQLGGEVTEEKLNETCPDRVVAFHDDEPIAMFGWMMMGSSLAVVHVVGNPDLKSLGSMARIADAYKVAEDHARGKGVKILYAQIPKELEGAIKMAVHMGFVKLPYEQLVKGLS